MTLWLQVKPGPEALSELQSQLNDMLDDSASDDAASLSQLTSPGPPAQQPSLLPSPILRQGPGVATTDPSLSSGLTGPARTTFQADNAAKLQQGAASDAQAAKLKMQLQVWTSVPSLLVCLASLSLQAAWCIAQSMRICSVCSIWGHNLINTASSDDEEADGHTQSFARHGFSLDLRRMDHYQEYKAIS